MKALVIALLFTIIPSTASPEFTATGTSSVREDFDSLDDWNPIRFSRIDRHSEYSVREEGTNPVLMAKSDASASGIIWEKVFSVAEYPRLRWRWKIMNTYRKADPRSKEGDDYPMRIYAIFERPEETASFWQRIGSSVTKSLTGVDPSLTCLIFVWTGSKVDEKIFSSPYADRIKIVVLREEEKDIGTWQEESVNIPEVYRQAFGEEPPRSMKIAVMNDSDNTGEKSVSYLDYIEVTR